MSEITPAKSCHLSWLSKCSQVMWNLLVHVSSVPHPRWVLRLHLTLSGLFWMSHGCWVSPHLSSTWISRRLSTLPFVKRSWVCQRGSRSTVTWTTYVTSAFPMRTFSSCLPNSGRKDLLFSRLVSLLLWSNCWTLSTLEPGAPWTVMTMSCPLGVVEGKVVSTAPLCSTWDTPWLFRKSVWNSCSSTCALELDFVTILPFWVSHSAKFVPEAGRTRFHCGSLTSEVTFVDDQAFLMTATTPRRLWRVIAPYAWDGHLSFLDSRSQH